MPADTIDMKALTDQTVKEARWEAQRSVSRLGIAPVRIGLISWAVNLLLRRPVDFPTFAFAKFRREVLAQSRRFPLDDGDVAIVKVRARMLSSTIDARTSKPLDRVSVDLVAQLAQADASKTPGVSFSPEQSERVADAVWKQFADSFGFHTPGRAALITEAQGFVPRRGAELAARLRELEAEAIAELRGKPRQS